MRSVLTRAWVKLVGTLFPIIFRPSVRQLDLVRIGSDYGGWWIPSTGFDASSVCYCAGVGRDASFDIGLIERFGCRVWGIDPTPESVAWVKSQNFDERFTLVERALAGQDGVLRLYRPRDASHVSYSSANLQRTQEFITVPSLRVSALMRELGHVQLALLKLDIEGAQHAVIDAMLREDIRPGVLAVEFDQPEPIHKTVATIRKLRRAGYQVAKVEWLNFTFVR